MNFGEADKGKEKRVQCPHCKRLGYVLDDGRLCPACKEPDETHAIITEMAKRAGLASLEKRPKTAYGRRGGRRRRKRFGDK